MLPDSYEHTNLEELALLFLLAVVMVRYSSLIIASGLDVNDLLQYFDKLNPYECTFLFW